MTKLKLWLQLVGLAIVVGLSSGAPANAQTVGDFKVYLPIIRAVHPFVSEVVLRTNQHRATVGCGALALNDKLIAAAYGHSQDMALNDFFSHTGSNGSNAGQRITAAGYSWSTLGENIAAGYSSPADVMAGWLNSTGHRANIENCNFTEIGVGYFYLQNDTGLINYHHYWTQTFARP